MVAPGRTAPEHGGQTVHYYRLGSWGARGQGWVCRCRTGIKPAAAQANPMSRPCAAMSSAQHSYVSRPPSGSPPAWRPPRSVAGRAAPRCPVQLERWLQASRGSRLQCHRALLLCGSLHTAWAAVEAWAGRGRDPGQRRPCRVPRRPARAASSARAGRAPPHGAVLGSQASSRPRPGGARGRRRRGAADLGRALKSRLGLIFAPHARPRNIHSPPRARPLNEPRRARAASARLRRRPRRRLGARPTPAPNAGAASPAGAPRPRAAPAAAGRLPRGRRGRAGAAGAAGRGRRTRRAGPSGRCRRRRPRRRRRR
jgi:hypothetical protein